MIKNNKDYLAVCPCCVRVVKNKFLCDRYMGRRRNSWEQMKWFSYDNK